MAQRTRSSSGPFSTQGEHSNEDGDHPAGNRGIDGNGKRGGPGRRAAVHELSVHVEMPMKKPLAVILAVAVLPAFAPAAKAQNLDDIFREVNPSVVVVRAKGRDVGAAGITRFNETGSGVLIS